MNEEADHEYLKEYHRIANGADDKVNARIRRELIKLRATHTRPAEERLSKPLPFNRLLVDEEMRDAIHGWRPSRSRKTSPHWKQLRGSYGSVFIEPDGKLSDPNQFADEVGPFKVRWLSGPKMGEVEDVEPFVYLTLQHPRNVIAEPVPDDEPICPPVRPRNMSSIFSEAQAKAGKALKKDPSTLKFAEVAAFFFKKLQEVDRDEE